MPPVIRVRPWHGLLLALVCVLVLAGMRVRAAVAALESARALAAPEPRAVLAACEQVQLAYGDLRPLLPLADIVGVLPIEKARVWAQAPLLARAGSEGCQALASLRAILDAAGDGDNTEGGSGEAVLAALRANPESVTVASGHLLSALDALEHVDTVALAGEPRFAALAKPLSRVQAQYGDLRTAAEELPELTGVVARLLGGGQPRTYLVLNQNEDEPRATGGFIGTLALVHVESGKVTSTEVMSSYLKSESALPPLPAPEPMRKYMNAGGWYLRDANWWVDYRRSAAQVLLMWDRAQGGADRIDGVIALDQRALESVLRAVGPVDVPDLGGVVTADTVNVQLDDGRRFAGDYQQVKSDLLAALYRAVMQRATSARGPELVRIGQALYGAAQDGHLLVWFRDPEVQALVAQQGWDGRLDPGSGDFLGVVDTSMSYGKLRPYLERQVSYEREANGTSIVTVTYQNRFDRPPDAAWDPLISGLRWDWQAGVFRKEQGDWLNYARVLAPLGADLVDASGWDDAPSTSAEGPVTVFGAPVLVRPGETRTVRLVYRDPAPTDAPLVRFRQPGWDD